MQRQSGLTLLELLVVLVIIGLLTAGVSLALRDNSTTLLEREGQRLVAKLEAARVQSRTSGQTLVWRANASGFVIEAWPLQTTNAVAQENWLQNGTQANVELPLSSGAKDIMVVLGPEPILSPTRIVLSIPAQNTNVSDEPHKLSIGTDGLRPFEVLP